MTVSFNMVMEIVLSLALLFAGIAVLVVIHIYVVGRAFRDNRYPNGRARSFVQGIGPTPPRISIEDLQKLPQFTCKSASPAVECTVCLESFRPGDSCRLLPNCTHSFHSHCIDSWLLKTPVCPICRAAINPPPSCQALENEEGGEDRASPTDVHVELT
ncbi:RING-H2 finger protein ATL64-like [Punica granatum]|uniref:RING-type E3 ubiquitin transferase n=2 Tax=Punica granatum TaxID=22663 RepID=A0A218Y0A1_PUNGR|nr:RING-H2 finger protein ATL64-like [Punica granatum]OWM90488.1 hypothetical protein CDL15_Pgr014791 [Punica granatum]PKI59145.1 hypothetical protein CRG98_020511 [Punica granatum]